MELAQYHLTIGFKVKPVIDGGATVFLYLHALYGLAIFPRAGAVVWSHLKSSVISIYSYE